MANPPAPDKPVIRIGVLTSGGDAPGMNAAVRAVVRSALDRGAEAFAIYEGLQGLIDGADKIRQLHWESVSNIIQRGGTIIGTARSAEFLTRAGRTRAAANLLRAGIDRLVVVGGDGSLTGAQLLHTEWPELLRELVADGSVPAGTAARFPQLYVAGLPGSIDNDIPGTDISIGADSALHRITNAVDAITSTAASHQRSFVVEVMGRSCGYLALMSALATGADWVLIPESPPNLDEWQQKMSSVLRAGRSIGRRDSMVIVAEGARDRHGNPISTSEVKAALEEHLQEEVRLTILGHVQRGGSPSAFDRNLSTILGCAAVTHLLQAQPGTQPQLVGIRGNRAVITPLHECLATVQAIAAAMNSADYERAMELRGGSFRNAFRTVRTLVRALPHAPQPGRRQMRIAIVTSGGPAAGMNTAVRAAVRVGIDQGHTMLGIADGVHGMIENRVSELTWMSVNGWAHMGGAQLGTNRKLLAAADYAAIARTFAAQNVQALLLVGGYSAYRAAHGLLQQRANHPEFRIPLVCLPATIDNDLPGSDLSIGTDTALNNIVDAVDKIKQSAVASRRVMVVEVMGRYCGYLALMAGMATGAERVYLHEQGVHLAELQADVQAMASGFKQDKKLGLIIRNEYCNAVYDTRFMWRLFAEEGRGIFEARYAILGHLQQGGDPSPFDRIQATRLATRCLDYIYEQGLQAEPAGAFIGLRAGQVQFTPLAEFPAMMDAVTARPREQWWLALLPVLKLMAQAGPQSANIPQD
ncbi:MAG: 6-phosphofructokinase [Chloroflexi bacterium]|nr:MAG: 6-phosphofructokinase [Chloroflexota bacterium]RLT50536.1 MAG: 6-phosphofructokinase [Chloroflexota bacterium]